MADKKDSPTANQQTQDPSAKILALQRVYVKDISFEAPNTPQIFTKKWQPKMDVHINTSFNRLQENIYECVIKVSITAKNENKIAFIAEAQQAGTFNITNLNPEELSRAAIITCPTVIFPYVRETLDGLMVKGSFPPLHLAQVNFQMLYEAKQQELAKQQAQQQSKSATKGEEYVPPPKNKIN